MKFMSFVLLLMAAFLSVVGVYAYIIGEYAEIVIACVGPVPILLTGVALLRCSGD